MKYIPASEVENKVRAFFVASGQRSTPSMLATYRYLIEELQSLLASAVELPGPVARPAEDGLRELVEAYDEYIGVLNQGIGEFVGIAYVHGMNQSPDIVEHGKRCREKIAALAKGGGV